MASIVAIAALGQLVILRPASAGQTVLIRSVHALAQGDGTTSVSVQVSNLRSTPVTARVWWLLSPPGKGSEWDRRAYQSAVRPLVVGPGASMDLQWTEAAFVPQGGYVLSAWAHVPGPGGFVHADGRLADSRLVVGPQSLLRAGPPRFDMSIVGVTATSPGSDPAQLDAAVLLFNRADAPRRAHVRLALGPAAGVADPSWWRSSPTWATGDVTVDLGPGAHAVVPVRGEAVVPTGRYLVRVTLLDPAPDLEGPIDEVAVADFLHTIGSAS